MTSPDAGFLGFAMLNGSVLAIDALQVSPLGSGFMFGEGVFETVRVQDSRPMLWDAHYARLAGSMRRLEAAPIASSAELHDRCREVIAANSLADGSLKIMVFKDVAEWSEIIAARAPAYAAARYEAGFRLQTISCESRRDPLHALKSLNYLSNIRAKRSAVAAGFDEALLIDARGQVLEGATTNVFLVREDGVISTPPLSARILPGVMRACVLRLLAPDATREREITLEELLQADEVFVTNALLGVMPVAAVDGTDYDLAGNAVTRALMAGLHDPLR